MDQKNEIYFNYLVVPEQGGNAVLDGSSPGLFRFATMDLCRHCFKEESVRFQKEFKFPPVVPTGDGTRYRVF